MTVRKLEVRLYPNQQQSARLTEIFGLHCDLYNAALEERIGAWKKAGVGRSLYDQQRATTIIRAENPEFKALDAQSLGMTLTRLELAFQAFFRRAKAGFRSPGFPRFKSKARFDSFTLRQTGWKFHDGFLKIAGVGLLRSRGLPHLTGNFKTCTIKRKVGKWFATIAVDVGIASTRTHGTTTTAFDWGLENFLTIGALDEDSQVPSISKIENPFYLTQTLDRLAILQQSLSRKKKGSANWKRAKRKIARLYEKTANQRKDFLHKQSAALVAQSAVIITEELNVSKMSQSKATTRNRKILDSAPSMFLEMLRYKAEDAGTKFVELDTRKLKPSQTCWQCKRQEKKLLTQRLHDCVCGAREHRDVATVKFMLSVYLGAGDQSALPTPRGIGAETH